MANRLYTPFKTALLSGAAVDLAGATDLKLVLCDAAEYAPDTDADEFLSDIPAAARVATTAVLANVTVTGGVVDADDPALPDTGGDEAEYLVLFQDTGNEATSRLILLIDTATGLPITPDSVEDAIQFHASGIFAL